MGILDVSLPDASSVIDHAKEHKSTFGALAGFAGASVGAGMAAGAPMASIILPLIAQNYAEKATNEILSPAEKKLRNVDEEKSNTLLRICDGICEVIDPLVDEETTHNRESLQSVAQDDPEQINQVFERILNDEQNRKTLQDIEKTLGALFAGEDPPEDSPIDQSNPEEIVPLLKDIFDVESEREALHLYTVYSEFLGDVAEEVQTESNDASEVQGTLESLQSNLEQVEQWRNEVIDTYTRLTLENQAFQQLTALDFESQDPFRSKPPRYLWLTDFNFAEIAARHHQTNQPYYFDRILPEGHSLRNNTADSRPTVTESIVSELDTDSNLMLVGSPGSGKSQICKQVAATWYSNSYGDVFYRESIADKPFNKDAELIEAIENADDDSDERVLVVVEDAVSDHASQIFDVLEHFRSRPDADVQFLLDSRQSQWKEYARGEQPNVDPPKFAEIAHKEGESELLEVINIPSITRACCQNAIKTFNQTTTGYYGAPKKEAEYLHDVIVDDTGKQGDLLILTDEIVRNSTYTADSSFIGDTPVRASASELHAKWLDWIEESGEEAPLGYQLAIAVSTLTVADIELSSSQLYSIADNKREIKKIADILEGSGEAPVEITGTLLIPDDSTAAGYNTRHTQWAFEFLASQLQRSTTSADTVHETFVHVVSTMAGLVDNQNIRQNIRRWLTREGKATPFLDRLDEEPSQAIEEFLQAVISIGRLQDGELVYLLEESFIAGSITEQRNLPASCDSTTRFELEIMRGWLLLNARTDNKLSDPEAIFEDIVEDATTALSDPERDWIRARATVARAEIAKDRLRYTDAVHRFETAIDHYESIGRTVYAAITYRRLANLGRSTDIIGWETVNKHYNQAIELFDNEDKEYEVIRTATVRASTALNQDSIGWEEVLTQQRKSFNKFDTYGIDPEYAYWHCRVLREYATVAQKSEELDWQPVFERYQNAIERYEDANEDQFAARLTRELATVAAEMDALDWVRVKDLYQDSVSKYQLLGKNKQAAYTYRSMAKASRDFSDAEWDVTENAYGHTISQFKEVGNDERVIDILQERADASIRQGSVDWRSVEKFYQEAIAACEDQNNATEAAQTLRDLAEAAATRELDFEKIEMYYGQAITRFKSIGQPTEAAKLQKRRGEVAADLETVDWNKVVDCYEKAINQADKLGLQREVARIKRGLARVAKESPIDWSEIENYYIEAATAFEEAGMETKAGMTYRWLAEVSSKRSAVPWETKVDYYRTSSQYFTGENETFEIARNNQLMATAARENNVESWENIQKYYEQSIEKYTQSDHSHRVVEVYRELGDTAIQYQEPSTSLAGEYYQLAIEQSEQLDLQRKQLNISLTAAANFSESGSEKRAIEWFDRCISIWCKLRDGTSQSSTTDKTPDIIDMGDRLLSLLPDMISLVSDRDMDEHSQKWCQKLRESIPEEMTQSWKDDIEDLCGEPSG